MFSYKIHEFELPQNLHQRLSKAVKTCRSWCHNSWSTINASCREMNTHSYRGPGLASEYWATFVHVILRRCLYIRQPHWFFICICFWIIYLSTLMICTFDLLSRQNTLIDQRTCSVGKMLFSYRPLFAAWRHNALFGTDPGNSLRKP